MIETPFVGWLSIESPGILFTSQLRLLHGEPQSATSDNSTFHHENTCLSWFYIQASTNEPCSIATLN